MGNLSITNSTRAKSIKEVLKSTELKLGLVNYQSGKICSDSQDSLILCLSVTIRFQEPVRQFILVLPQNVISNIFSFFRYLRGLIPKKRIVKASFMTTG